jgi:hypothetical protein
MDSWGGGNVHLGGKWFVNNRSILLASQVKSSKKEREEKWHKPISRTYKDQVGI